MFLNQRFLWQNTAIFTLAIAASLNISQPASSQTTVSLPGFDPSDDGFQFSNQTMANSLKSSADLKSSIIRNYATGYADTLKFLFGEKAVCQGYDENGKCYTSFQSRQWMSDQALRAANYGVCDGMAVASQILWLVENQSNNPFGDRSTNLSNILGGQTDIAANTLPASNSNLQELILEAYASQTADEIFSAMTASREQSPSALLNNIQTSITNYAADSSQWQALLTVGINRIAPDGRLIDGHTLVPFAVETVDATKSKVHVYDVNYPNTTQYLEIDTQAETWRYQPSGSQAYEGNSETNSLGVVSLAERAIPYIDEPFVSCPFCATAASTVEISFVGVGELLIAPFGIDGAVRSTQIGFEPNKKEYVNTLAGASMIETQGGLGESIARTYTIPGNLDEYQIDYIGLPESGLDGYISVTKPGLTAQFETYTTSPFRADLNYARRSANITTPNPNVIKHRSSADKDVSFTISDQASSSSYQVRFKGGGGAGTKFFRADKENMRIEFGAANNDGSDTTFDIEITRIYPEGSKVEFQIQNFTRKPTEFSSLDLTAIPWGDIIASREMVSLATESFQEIGADEWAEDFGELADSRAYIYEFNIDVIDLEKNSFQIGSYWDKELEKGVNPNYEQRPHRGTRKKGK